MRWLTLILVLVASPVFGQNFFNIDDTLTGWQNPPCFGTACAGGTGTASNFVQTINNTTPSLDGKSMEIGFTGPVLSAGQTTNVLWPKKVGANANATWFYGIYNIYYPNAALVQAGEFDQFKFDGIRYMMGSECDNPSLTAGFWRIWDSCGGSWVTTTTACTIFAASNTWHQIKWATHVDADSSTACGGHPCIHYDALSVDGKVTGPYTNQPACSSADANNVGIQPQIDESSVGGAVTAFLDEASLSVSNTLPIGTCPAAVPSGVTGCYYIAANGNDANDGTTETTTGPHGPWQHAPGMPGATGVPAFITPVPGTGVIFRGGDTWGPTNYFTIANGGTSGAPVYYGVDKTWFSGAAWNRPILAIAGSLPNQISIGNNGYTGSVTVSGTGVTLNSGTNFNANWSSGTKIILNGTTCSISSVNSVSSITLTTSCGSSGTYNIPTFESPVVQVEAPWITFDNFEVTGMTCTPTVGSVFFYPTGSVWDGLAITNSYFHAMQSPSTSCGGTTTADKLADGNNSAIWLFQQGGTDKTKCNGHLSYDVIDGSDGTGGKGYQIVGADASPCLTIDHTVIHDVCSAWGGYFPSVHDNVIGNFGGQVGQLDCSSTLGLHNHAIRSEGDIAGMSIYNNVIYKTEGETISINPQSGTTSIYNNVLYANAPAGTQVCDNGSGCSAGSVLFANNTDEQVSGGGSPALSVLQPISTLTIANNFDICTSATFASCYSGTNKAATLTTPGGELYLTASAATTAGYTSSQSNPYSPISSGSPTVGIGKPGVYSGESLATTRGCFQGIVAGVTQSICPTINPAPRAITGSCIPGTAGCADAGADMFTGSNPALTVTTSGSGTVTSSPAGITCPGVCSATYTSGTAVVLTATPAPSYSFTSWTGACSGAGACSLTMSAPRTVGATFTQQTASVPVCTPGAGSYSSTISTSCTSTGPVLCYNFTGAPATNGTNGCTTGTLYTGPIAISATVTLYIVGGGAGRLDSAVGSFAFTVTTVGNVGNGNAINAVEPPLPSGTDHTPYLAVLAQNNPLLSGQTLIIGLGGTTGLDQEAGTGVCSPNLTAGFALWDTYVALYPSNIIASSATEGGTNTYTSNCAFSQAQANASALTYAAGNWFPGYYVCVGGSCPTAGTYWQVANNAYSSPSLDNTCNDPGGANLTGAGPVVSGPCTWTNVGANAPPQNGYCGPSYTCDHFWTSGPGFVINLNNYTTVGPGGGTLTTLYSSQPIPTELPIVNWQNAVVSQLIPHYNGKIGYVRFGWEGGEISLLGVNSGLWPNYGSTNNQQRAQALSGLKIYDTFIMAQNPTMTVCQDMHNAASNDQTYSDQEAQLAHDLNFTCIGTNGLQVNDVLNLTNAVGAPNPCAFPLVSSNTCGGGDWPYNFSRFPKNAAGQRMFHTLQTLTGSTPLDCAAGQNPGVTGPLGPLPVGSTYCAAGFPGLLPFLTSLCTTGVNGGAVKICDSIFELYPIAPTNNPNAGIGNQAWPAGDTLFALDATTYCSTNMAQCSAPDYRPQINGYQAAMAQYLGLGYGLGVQPPTGVTFTIGSSFGPPNYPELRTDLAIAPPGGVITVPPQVGPNVCTAGNLSACGNVTGANTCFTDPDFGTQICRMTDSLSTSGANSVQTEDAGGSQIGNCTGTPACGGNGPTYVALKTPGTNRWLFQFNPATMQTTQPGALIGPYPIAWAHTHANRAYYLTGTVLTQMDVTPGTLTFTTTPLYDFGGTSCLGNAINGQFPYTLVWSGVFQPSADDNVFGIGFGNQPGGQDHGYHFASYNIATGHCVVVNTFAGNVVDNGTLVGSVSFAERFYIHEAHSEPNPNYAFLIVSLPNGCISGTCAVGPYLFSPGSTAFTYCGPSPACTGEDASGYTQIEEGNGTGNIHIHAYTNFGVSPLLISNPALIPSVAGCAGNTNHPSWNNDDGTGTLPIFTSYTGTCASFTSAWQKEILAIFQNGQKVGRVAHSFGTGVNAQFDISNMLGQSSMDGRFVFYTSDHLNTLGPALTTVSGTACASPNCRGDVFVVKP